MSQDKGTNQPDHLPLYQRGIEGDFSGQQSQSPLAPLLQSGEPVRIQIEDFSQDSEIAALKSSSKRMGGIATFLGCARDFSEGRDVSQISFEAYGSMALAEMSKLREEAIAKFDLLDARIVHRVTTVQAGDNIVFIAAGAAHRAAAFDACRWMIDELKQRVPIWKKEVTPEGESWVTQHP
jgi:molybdopterin synthase catalytic subunit